MNTTFSNLITVEKAETKKYRLAERSINLNIVRYTYILNGEKYG